MNPIEKREHFAKIRREVVLHRMATADSLDDRLFWGIILWSWTGPHTSAGGAVVLKDAKGFIRKDNFDKPIPAKQKDLLELLGLPPKWKGHVSAAIKRLAAKNSIHFEGDVVYADQEPALPKPKNPVTSTRNFYIGSRYISTGNLPTDPEARKRAVQWLEKTSTEWNGDLKRLRTRYHELLEQAAPGLGILYVLKEKKRRGEEEPAAAPVPSSLLNGHPPNGRTEESAPPVETVRPSGWEDQKFRKGKLLAYLTQNFDRPTPPDDVVLNPLASLISDEPVFLQFQEACKGFKPQNGWKGFLPIAKAVVSNHGNYTQAKAAAAAGTEAESILDRMMRLRQQVSEKNG